MEQLTSPEERQRWLEYQGEVTRQESDVNTPVKHKISTRDEPPLLVWLRERFAPTWPLSSSSAACCFGMAMFLARGLWSSQELPLPITPEADPRP